MTRASPSTSTAPQTSRRRTARLPALACAAVALTVACGGGTSASQAYFDELERADAQFGREGERLQRQLDGGLAAAGSDGERLAVYRTSIAAFETLVRDFVAELEALRPPDGAVNAHAEAVAAGRAVLAVFEGLAGSIGDARSAQEAETLMSQAFTSDAFARFDRSCAALQDAAREQRVDIDLHCGQ